MENWNVIATSAKNDFIPDDEHLHVVGLGEIAFNPKATGQSAQQQSYYGSKGLEHSVVQGQGFYDPIR